MLTTLLSSKKKKRDLLAFKARAAWPITLRLKEDCAIKGEKRRGLEMITIPGSTNLEITFNTKKKRKITRRCITYWLA